ncbi:hypothetical protein AM439_07130 [Enterobacter cloacae complex sp.]|nr:hypothetical protein AM439_07130 [Enterobacter cloacae complex sp.]
MVRCLPGGAALTGPTGARWCGICPVALRLPGLRGMVRCLPGGAALTGPTYAVFVGRVSEAPPGVVHASSSN